jgi:hypothetical protein
MIDKIGLCKNCIFSKIIESAKGSKFYLCLFSKINPNFPKYPTLPVLICEGYKNKENEKK